MTEICKYNNTAEAELVLICKWDCGGGHAVGTGMLETWPSQ